MIDKLIILCILLTIQHTTAQPESPLQSTCNSCCQGQTGREGNPGIPGVPGSNGHPGNVGQKGDKGDSLKGERGEVGGHGDKGNSGSPGLKGEQGFGGLRGPPGKTGPVGITRPGSPGSPGVKGQKGEIGQGQGTPLSVFTAFRRSSFVPSGETALPFQQFHTNVGNDFDLSSGRFTCEIPGIYMFAYSFLSGGNMPTLKLMKDDTLINSVYRGSVDSYDMLSNTAFIQLAVGEQVWLSCSKRIYSDGSFYTSFSGMLLHEN